MAQLLRIACRRLPEERRQVVADGPAATALEVDEAGRWSKHDVARLEVAIHKGRGAGSGGKVGGHLPEVLLEASLVEVDAHGLEEAVLEVVEVEHHVVGIEGRLRVADAEVETLGPHELQARQQPDGLSEQQLLLAAVVAARLSPAAEGVEERARAEILLQVAHLVGANGIDLRHGKALFPKVAGQRDEGMILLTAGADAADDRLGAKELPQGFAAADAIVLAVAACSRQFLDGQRIFARPLAI